MEITIDTISAFGIVVWATDSECAIGFEAELGRFEVENVRRRCGLSGLALLPAEERQAIEDWLFCVSH